MNLPAEHDDAQEQLREVERTARPRLTAGMLAAGVAVLLFSFVLSVSLGAANIDFLTVWEAMWRMGAGSQEHQIIWGIRLPRVIGAAMVGAAFAVAGAVMQGMTRNPLADSGLLGINAGSAFALSLCFALLPELPYIYLVMFSFAGAALGAAMVYGIGSLSRGGLAPIRLVLAGAAVSALLGALSEGIALYFNTGQDLAFWYSGGVSGTRWSHLAVIGPWLLAALAAVIAMSRSVTILSLGEETAVGLGENVARVKLAGMIIVVVLAGLAVAVVGAVSFVGLIVPHVARRIVGYDYRLIIPTSAVFGAVFVTLADLAARILNPPYEIPIGAVIALVGIPFFLYVAGKGERGI